MDPTLKSQLKSYVYDIVGCCINVHNTLGPYLNEYMYQDAVEIEFESQGIPYAREYYFSVTYKDKVIKHRHYVDYLVKNNILLECKAVDTLGAEQRQQLWNYMRLTKMKVGVLFNFAPYKFQCEKYYLPSPDATPIAF